MALPAGLILSDGGSFTAETPVELIAAARRSLRQAEQLLLDPTPRDLAFSCSLLAQATDRINRLRDLLASGGCDASLRTPGLLEVAAGLRAQVASIGVLMDRAASFHGGLLQCMMEASQPAAHPAARPMETAPRVQLDL